MQPRENYWCQHPKLFLQAGITNGDYEAAGFSGQLDVVTFEGPTSDTVAGQDLIKVIVPATAAVLVVVLFLAVILFL